MSAAKRRESKNDRRLFLSAGLCGLAAASLNPVSGAAQQADSSATPPAKRTGLFPPDVKAADAGYSPGILAEGRRIIFVSGQGPKNVKAEMETQMRETFERIGRVLEQGGASFEHVVLMRSFFVHLSRDLPVYRKIRREFLKKPYPASTAVGTTELAIPGLEIEIEAVAVI